MNKQIEAMKKLGMSEKEIEEVLNYDKKVEKNEKTEYDLTKEQQKNVKKMTNTTSMNKKTAKTQKKRAENPEKRMIIEKIFKVLEQNADFTEIKNAEREIAFTIGEKNYSITLTQHRK